VFNYDIQSVVDAFFYDYLQAVGLDLAAIDVREAREDLSEYYETLKNNVRLVIEETVRTSAELSATSRELASATQQVAEATNQLL
jgi:methyl-accepting chemotaxis protein